MGVLVSREKSWRITPVSENNVSQSSQNTFANCSFWARARSSCYFSWGVDLIYHRLQVSSFSSYAALRSYISKV